MTAAIPATWPDGAAILNRLGQILMDVILHLGAHRTATTTFQHYMRDQADRLDSDAVAFWGPERTRRSVFPGLFRRSTAPKGLKVAQRAEGRIRMLAAQAQSAGVAQLLVSDENMLGTCIHNLRSARLYPAAGERTARVSAAFGGRVRRIVLSIRSQDLWWASSAALTVARGHPVPSAARFDAIAGDRRSWRDVITDLACAAPGAEIEVLTFEATAGSSDRILACALDTDAPSDRSALWLNRSADLPHLRRIMAEQGGNPDLLPDDTGRWQPFTPQQSSRLRDTYADDLLWLKAGADGLARLTEDTAPTRADISLPAGMKQKGLGYDKGQLAQHR